MGAALKRRSRDGCAGLSVQLAATASVPDQPSVLMTRGATRLVPLSKQGSGDRGSVPGGLRGVLQFAGALAASELGVMDDVFVVDQVQLLSASEVEHAKASLQTLCRLAWQIHLPSRKRGASWSDDFSPAGAKKCRSLGRSPTEAPIADA